MSEKPLLLSSAKSGVLVTRHSHPLLWIAFAIGVVVVAIGGADVASRAGNAVLGAGSGAIAFAPAIASLDPSVLSRVSGTPAPSTSTVSITPAVLRVPSLKIDAKVEVVGKRPDGSMATPTQIMNVAWYGLGSKPGEPGNAVFAGHLNNAITTAGVFERLASVKQGARIEVSDAAGKTLIYQVSEIRTYDTNEAPLREIFAVLGPSRVVLITCEGDWVASEHSFNKRLVVTADLVTP